MASAYLQLQEEAAETLAPSDLGTLADFIVAKAPPATSVPSSEFPEAKPGTIMGLISKYTYFPSENGKGHYYPANAFQNPKQKNGHHMSGGG